MAIGRDELIYDLREYVQDELRDSAYYQELADGTDPQGP